MAHRDIKPPDLTTVVVRDARGELKYTVPVAPERPRYRRGDVDQAVRRRRR